MPAPKGNKNALGNSGGGVSKYTNEFIELAKDYVDNHMETYEQVIPSIAGLALVSDIRRETLHTWLHDKEKIEFHNIASKLMAKQEVMLSGGGLTGKYNAAIAKLHLTKHGYSDKVDNTHAGPGGGPIEANHWIVEGVRPEEED
jgi:hypothetical protein